MLVEKLPRSITVEAKQSKMAYRARIEGYYILRHMIHVIQRMSRADWLICFQECRHGAREQKNLLRNGGAAAKNSFLQRE